MSWSVAFKWYIVDRHSVYLPIWGKLLFALGGKGLRGIQTNDENPGIFWELNKVQAMSRFDTFKGFIWTFRQASLTFSIWSFPAQYINTNDQFHNPIPTSPGLASFGVTSSSGFEVSSFRNLSKTTKKNWVNSAIHTKRYFEKAWVQENYCCKILG